MKETRIFKIINSFFSPLSDVPGWGAVLLKYFPMAPKLKDWVEKGYHADMAYMEKNLRDRLDPRIFKPWARSALMVMLDYPLGMIDTSDVMYPIASYALGPDYHQKARRILKDLETLLRDSGAVKEDHFYSFVDTAPVFERELAAGAGLGWRGKNCCTINKFHGSAFFLAGCLVDFDIHYGKPLPDHCGKCRKCLDACPTGALTAPGTLDARRCVSYLTIEHRKEIEQDLKAQTGNWIFGCDVCQQVCPWNRKHLKKPGKETSEIFFLTKEQWRMLLQKGGGFKSRFKNTPLQRAGRKLMHRNLENAVKNAE